jgi:hypothetical protein
VNPLRYKTLAFAALCAMAWSTAGQAQQAGTYSGTSADGEPLSFIVGTDFNTGNLAVLGATVSFYAPCRSQGNPVNTTWGFGFTQDIKNGKASLSYTDTYYFYITANFVFNGTAVTGSITSRTATFVPGNPVPNKAQYCIAPKQAFSANLSLDAKTPPLPPGASIHYQNAK